MNNKICRCGCGTESEWLVKSYDFDPNTPDNKGKYFEEQCCTSAKLYLVESSHELGFECSYEYIGPQEFKSLEESAI